MSDKFTRKIETLLEQHNLSMKQASIKSGLGETFVRDMLKRGKRPSIDAVGRLAETFSVPVSYLLADDLPEASAPAGEQVQLIKVIGKVAANSWLSVEDMDFSYEDIELVPSAAGYPADWQFALVVEGNCLNKIANNGDRLICLDIVKAHIPVNSNDLVIVQRSRYGGQMIERTAKRVRQTSDGYELWPESTDPNHQLPIKLNAAAEGEEIRIIARVLWILRKP